MNSVPAQIFKVGKINSLMLKYFPEKLEDEFVDQQFNAKLKLNEYGRHILASAARK